MGNVKGTEYIGFYTAEERKALFMKKFGVHNRTDEPLTAQSPLHVMDPTFEDPYEPDSWYTKAQLTRGLRVDPVSGRTTGLVGSEIEKRFHQRYTVKNLVALRSKSITQPDLYNVDSVSDYFARVLSKEKDLFMKVTPLIVDAEVCLDVGVSDEKYCAYKDDEDLAEIYNEIVVAYFLNELVYGYSHVLSLNFMTIVDWFVARRSLAGLGATSPEPRSVFYQVVVSERLDLSLDDYFKSIRDRPDESDLVRACLFQVFHALETAWHTNEYTHGDLHLDNIMLQRIGKDSPLYRKAFLFRRKGYANWMRIPVAHLNDYIVKIIDFGRSRLRVPSSPLGHIPTTTNPLKRHVHDRLIELPWTKGSRQADVTRVLTYLRRKELGGPEFVEYVNRFYATVTPNERTASSALDDEVFHPYISLTMLPQPGESLTLEQILSEKDRHVVVSFVADFAELLPLSSSLSSIGVNKPEICAICRQAGLGVKYTTVDREYFCGRACYEFKYVFGQKTIYR